MTYPDVTTAETRFFEIPINQYEMCYKMTKALQDADKLKDLKMKDYITIVEKLIKDEKK
jgi:hypothetical protein